MNKKEKVSQYLNKFYMGVYQYMNSLLLELNNPNITKEKKFADKCIYS